MKKKKKETDFYNQFILCDCGYYNPKENIERYGTCRRCNKVLDKKAKFNYEMYVKLHKWVKGKK